MLSTLALVPPSLRKLTLILQEDVSTDSAEQLLKLLVYRTPGLTDLVFRTTHLTEVDIGDRLRNWLSISTKLKRVTLPQFYLTNTTIQTLSRFDSLETIGLDADPSIPYSDSPAGAFPIEDGGFPSLHGLHINLPLPVRASGLGAPDLFGKLQALTISERRLSTNKDLRISLQAIVSSCPQIVKLCLNLFTDQRTRMEPILFDSIQPVFRLRLKTLIVHHDSPMYLRKEDVEEMGRHWGELQQLSLCPDPRSDTLKKQPTWTPLSLLPAFAQHLPKLRSLALFLDKTSVPSYDGDILPTHQLEQLTVLNTGTSWVPGGNPYVVGHCIGAICPQIEILSSSPSKWRIQGDLANDSVRQRDWVTVGVLVKLVGLSSQTMKKRLRMAEK
ncbi:hypothetical protein FRC01_008583 [Tulasnella sp. 417]|nr:hypothetical protein FRC01_008583 [Tulasnella sp. 417]